MDILMTYWNSVWRTALERPAHATQSHSPGEWAAFRRSAKRSSPLALLLAKAGRPRKSASKS